MHDQNKPEEPVNDTPIDHTPLDIQQLLDRPSAPDEPPGRALAAIGRAVEEVTAAVIRDHLRRHHTDEHIETLEDVLDQLEQGRRP